MKFIQTLGLLLTLTTLLLGARILAPGGDPGSRAAAEVMGVPLFVLVPSLFALTLLLQVPSTAALCRPSVRQRFGIQGGWRRVWLLNGALSLMMLGLVAWAFLAPLR